MTTGLWVLIGFLGVATFGGWVYAWVERRSIKRLEQHAQAERD